jgi:hypothetical protein
VLLILVILRMVLNVARKPKGPLLLRIIATNDTTATAAIVIPTITAGSALMMTLKCAALARLEAVCVSRDAPWSCQGLVSMLITPRSA